MKKERDVSAYVGIIFVLVVLAFLAGRVVRNRTEEPALYAWDAAEADDRAVYQEISEQLHSHYPEVVMINISYERAVSLYRQVVEDSPELFWLIYIPASNAAISPSERTGEASKNCFTIEYFRLMPADTCQQPRSTGCGAKWDTGEGKISGIGRFVV